MSDGGFFGRIHDPSEPPANALGPGAIFVCVMSIGQIAIGAETLDDCPRQPYIPVYLIVMGVFGLMLAVLLFLMSIRKFSDIGSDLLRTLLVVSLFLICLFQFCWFIAGNVWIFSFYKDIYHNNKNVDKECKETLYPFAFWTTIYFYILLGEFLVYLILIVWHTPRNLGNDIETPTNQ